MQNYLKAALKNRGADAPSPLRAEAYSSLDEDGAEAYGMEKHPSDESILRTERACPAERTALAMICQ